MDESIMEYLDIIEDLLENSKSVPFSNRVSIDKERIFEVLNEMRMNIPKEVRQAQRIVEDHDKIINEAENKANSILKEANSKALELTDEHGIYKQAMGQALELMDEAKKDARELRLSSMNYADEILSRTENAVREALTQLDQNYRLIEDEFIKTINILYNSRQELRGVKGN